MRKKFKTLGIFTSVHSQRSLRSRPCRPARSRRRRRPSRSTTTTSAASCAGRTAPRPAYGSSRRRAIFPCASSRSSLPTTRAATCCRPAAGELRHLGARLRPRRQPEGEERARQAAQSDRRRRPERRGGREVLSGDLLVLDDEDPGRRGVRQQGCAGQSQDHRLSQRDEEQRLRRLSPARPALDPHHSEIPHGRRQEPRGSLGAPHLVRTGRREHDHGRRGSARRHAVPLSRRLDPAGGEGRASVGQADAAAGHRAQHRGHAARLAQSEAISARPDRQRPALSDRERLRPARRAMRACLQRHAHPRSDQERRDQLRAADAPDMPLASAGQCRLNHYSLAFGLLGRGEHLGQQGEQPQLDDGPERPRVAGGDRARSGQSGLLQEGLDAPFGGGIPAQQHQPPRHDVRSQDRQIHRLPDLLRLASSAVRLRRQRDAVDEHRRRRRQCRLDQHQDARRDRRHREVAGLDRACCRHQRQRPARRGTPSRASRRSRTRTCASARPSMR